MVQFRFFHKLSLLEDPAADRVTALVIGPWSGELYDDPPTEIIEALVSSAERLDLSHHYMSDEVSQQLTALPIDVDVSDQQDEDEYGRYVAICE